VGKLENSRTIIDTDILIDLLRNKKEAVDFVTALEKKKFVMSTTSINAFELFYGAHKSNDPEKGIEITKKLLRRMSVLPLTPKAAQTAGRIYAELETTGQPIGLRDTLIVAIALTRDLSVATRNIGHFRKITNLKIITAQEL
jgi:tRNA(fMet)-specific endonuclease VapC